ncbi:MAG: GNAT family N-acetyltransferase [Halanaerobiales bacterium]|nr:GNAT family N-acetyltransferase [Halanaerobiales bacterium]
MQIIQVNQNYKKIEKLSKLLISFRDFLASLKNRENKMTTKEGIEEIEYYLDKDFPIYIALVNDRLAGYFILKYDDDAVWLEHFFVKESFRNKKIGTALFKKAEEVIGDHGYVNLYNWVHPNNDRMINFLRKQEYDVLNMIEIRKKFKNEKLKRKIDLNSNQFRYN